MLNKITTKYSKFSPEFPCKDACVHAKSFRRVHIFVPLWTIACLAPLSMGFSRREYWSGMPCLSPGDCPNPGIEPRSPALQADSLPSEPVGKARICLQSRRHRKHQFNPWVRTIPWRRAWQPTLVFLPREFHVQRSLASYSPWGSKESDRAEHFTFFYC